MHAMMVSGSGLVKMQARGQGLDRGLIDPGFDFCKPGCSMCLAMNSEKLLLQE